MSADLEPATVIAGFFTGGALAVRGGMKAARNSAIACACLLAVIEGVGIGFQRMMAENTRLDVGILYREAVHRLLIHFVCTGPTASTTTGICGKLSDTFTCIILLVALFHRLVLDYDIKSSLQGFYNQGAQLPGSYYSLAVKMGWPCSHLTFKSCVTIGHRLFYRHEDYQYVLYAEIMLRYPSNGALCLLACLSQPSIGYPATVLVQEDAIHFPYLRT